MASGLLQKSWEGGGGRIGDGPGIPKIESPAADRQENLQEDGQMGGATPPSFLSGTVVVEV